MFLLSLPRSSGPERVIAIFIVINILISLNMNVMLMSIMIIIIMIIMIMIMKTNMMIRKYGVSTANAQLAVKTKTNQ